MTNKPHIWMDNLGTQFTNEAYKKLDKSLKEGLFPLYKHPAKTLTDEEIMVLYEEYIETQYASESNVLGFGRAILRKAQEK